MNFLSFSNWQIIDVTEEFTHFFVRAIYYPEHINCPKCTVTQQAIQKYGVRLKTIKDAPVRGKSVSVLLTIQRYKCLKCKATFLDEVPEIEDDSRFTKRLVLYIERESIRKNFLTVAGETGISDSAVRGIFLNFIRREGNIPVFETPTILCIDNVYIGGVACCILTDIEEKRVFDILPSCKMETVYNYLIHLKDKE